GLPVGNYVGAAIELTPASAGPWTAMLLLVEQFPAGTDGTPIARNLVRNMLEVSWNETLPPSASPQQRLFESRPMSLPAGTRTDRVQVVGWVQGMGDKMVALAQSACLPPD
ncbi:MAG: hypothetical protein WCH44_12710, partial [Betaproteobacteria bacterium]